MLFRKISKYLINKYERLRVIKFKLLSNCRNVKGKANIIQPLLISGNGTVQFGQGVYLGTRKSPYFYSGYIYIEVRNPEAKIIIEDNVWTNNNLTLISQSAGIQIKHDTIIGMNVEIYDCDFHFIDPNRRKEDVEMESKLVLIGPNAWIGSNVKILKGVSIGKNSIIAMGSIVTKDVPDNSIWGGIPAKFIKKIDI